MAIAQANRFGIKSGMAISNFSLQETELGGNIIEWGNSIAYQTGIFYNRRLDNSLLSFQFEIDYKKVGTSFDVNDIDPNLSTPTKTTYQFEYLGMSILPRIDLLPDRVLNPNFMFGAIMDIRTDSKLLVISETEDNDSITQNGFLGGDLNQRTSKNLFGYVMAGGIEIYTKPVIITVEGRYTSLFTKVFNDSVEELPLNAENYLLKIMEDSRSNYASFLLGFNFYF